MKTDAWEGLRQALVAQKERRPTGADWLTKEEIAKKLGMTHSGAESMIRRDRLKFESFEGWAVNGNKLVRRVWWRPIKQSEKRK